MSTNRKTSFLQGLVEWAERRGLVDRPRPKMTPDAIRVAQYDVLREQAKRMLQESVNDPYGASTADLGWRSLSARADRDLSEPLRRKMWATCEWLDAGNPVAKAGMDLRTSLVVSEGFEPKVQIDEKHPQAKPWTATLEYWSRRWWDANEWDSRVYDRVKDAGLMGEQLWVRGTPNSATGLWEAGLILPQAIASVELDPCNAERLLRVHLNEQSGLHVNGKSVKMLNLARRHRFGKETGTITGDAFYLPLNRRPGATRGVSDLLPVIDWIDQFDQLLYAQVERQRFLNAFAWDVAIDSDNTDSITERAQELRAAGPPGSGSVNVHGANEVWTPQAPDLKNADAKELLQYLFILIWGGLRLPEHWYSAANTVNLASAEVMDEPVWVSTRVRQRQIREFLQLMLDYALQDVAERVPEMTAIPASHRKVEVVSRDPDRTAWDSVGAALLGVGNALVVGMQGGLIDDSDAAKIYCTIASSLLNQEIKPPSEDASDPLAEAKRRCEEAYRQAESRMREAA